MKRYRILKDGKYFFVQEKILFSWCDVRDCCGVGYPKQFIKLNDAKKYIKRITTLPKVVWEGCGLKSGSCNG